MSKVIRHCFQQKAGRKDSESKPLEIISEQQVAALTSVDRASNKRYSRAIRLKAGDALWASDLQSRK
jgi:hypothetical protein